MADYDPNAGTDTSQAQPIDWWNQNAPPTPFVNTSPAAPFTNTSTNLGTGSIIINGKVVTGAGGPGGTPFDATGGNPWTDGAPPVTTSTAEQNAAGSFGGPIAPYQGGPYPTFTPPPLPDYLQKPFQLPSAADLQATPGYMSRYQQGLDANQRAAAANGTILNGGTQKALTRYGQDYASNEYNNLVNQDLSTRQQQSNDYLNLAYGPAWQQNQSAVNQYGQLYSQYKDNLAANTGAQNDYFNQQLGLLNAGLGAAKAGAVGTGG